MSVAEPAPQPHFVDKVKVAGNPNVVLTCQCGWNTEVDEKYVEVVSQRHIHINTF